MASAAVAMLDPRSRTSKFRKKYQSTYLHRDSSLGGPPSSRFAPVLVLVLVLELVLVLVLVLVMVIHSRTSSPLHSLR